MVNLPASAQNGKRNRYRRVGGRVKLRAAALAGTLLLSIASGCTSQSPPRVVISYSTTPLPAEFVLPTPSPTPTRSRRPTRASPVRTATVLPGSDTTTASMQGANGDQVGPSASPGPTAAPTSIPGQVPEAQGAFVTSSSRGSRYYYARDDAGWHRIQPENRVWFLTVDALLRAFPDRIAHDAPTATPSRPRTPTAVG